MFPEGCAPNHRPSPGPSTPHGPGPRRLARGAPCAGNRALRRVCYTRGMGDPAEKIDTFRGPDNSPAAARARGDALMHELAIQRVDPSALDRELPSADAEAVLAWLRGEAPCPLND